jgi:hypothetical protein
VRRTVTKSFLLALLALSAAVAAAAQDEPESKKRLEFMQAEVAGLVPEASELKAKDALAVGAKPMLRYSDPTRGDVKEANNALIDAGVWRLGPAGRPTALVTVELYQSRNAPLVVAFEFLSLTDAKFSLKHPTQPIRWNATGSALELKDLPDAPKPAAAPAARLVQMRQLAQRFGAKQRYRNEQTECRLVAQPIDRYSSEAQKVADGAIFALANGTNPEIGVLLETDGERWRYGVLRLCAAESTVTLDGKQVASFEYFDSKGPDGPYNGLSYRLKADK